MSNCVSFTPLVSFNPQTKPGVLISNCNARKVLWINNATRNSKIVKVLALESKAINSGEKNKPNSIVCAQCDGNGAIVCSQCKGDGVNSVDHFNGQFKAGGLCWLCRGKREILCGDCNGAGFIGGFMSTFDE
ncbi:hypothetical protein LguiA_019842 [Lonicera macranthoides]